MSNVPSPSFFRSLLLELPPAFVPPMSPILNVAAANPASLSRLDQCSNRHLRLLATSEGHPPPPAHSTTHVATTTHRRYPRHLRLGKPATREAYRRKRFLVFMKLLLKCLQKQQAASQSPEDFTVYLETQAVLADGICRHRHHQINSGNRRLVDVLTNAVKPLVGDVQWNRAEACLALYLQKRRHLRQQQQQRDCLQRYPPQSRPREPDPLDVLWELQQR